MKKEINEKNKITEMWDEDRGWVRWCQNCGQNINKEARICPHCHQELKEVERI